MELAIYFLFDVFPDSPWQASLEKSMAKARYSVRLSYS